MDNRIYYIYCTTNNINGMKYIGKHYGHLDDSYFGSGKVLKKAIEKYGKENFSKEVLYISRTEEENCQKEKEFIKVFNATESPQFYNIHEGGNGGNTTAGYTKEEKEALSKKLSEAQRGEKNGMYGKKHSEKTKRYLSFWATCCRDNSVYRTDEFREKMSEKTKGKNNGMYGKHHTEESKRKMSENSKDKTLGEKNGMFGKSRQNAINGKAIIMTDKDGKIIKAFACKLAALDYLGIKGHVSLNKALKNHTEYKGYYWENCSREKCRDYLERE